MDRRVNLTWILPTLAMAYSYARIWLEQDGLWQEKPYVYRQFVPLAAGLLVWLTGMEIRHAVVLVVAICALVFALALHTLCRTYHES